MSRPKTPDRVSWAVQLLDVRPSDHILEIGSGPGLAAALVCERLTRGSLTAIDQSAVAVARTRDRVRDHLASGRARVERATLADANLDRRFKKVFAINVNAFWTTPEESIPALLRVLGPRGQAWLIYEPPSESRVRGIRDTLTSHFAATGLMVDRVETRRFRSSVGLAILGRRR